MKAISLNEKALVCAVGPKCELSILLNLVLQFRWILLLLSIR
jgi:hypothetical protein